MKTSQTAQLIDGPINKLESAGSSYGTVLLQTAHSDADNACSYLFTNPISILRTDSSEEVPALLQQLEQLVERGYYASGFLGYEALRPDETGHNRKPLSADLPLCWFGIFSTVEIIRQEAPHSSEINGEYADGFVSNSQFGLSESEYIAAVEVIKEQIRSGATYQVNFTDTISFEYCANPIEIYRALLHRQPVPYAAFIDLGETSILSFSPELFFLRKGDLITVKPMKGTSRRGASAAEDDELAARLSLDEKNRSENVMIVDLMRNDLGRLCEVGSIRVDNMFAVERFETLLQMTSEVSGTLRPNTTYRDLLTALFPCGSVTGAPKLSTMKIIAALERRSRGIYTGCIGFISPNREAVFSVAIRTAVLRDGKGDLGVGSGIVIDSDPHEEYKECLLKASFLTGSNPQFELLESLLWRDSFPHLDLHLARLERSAAQFAFPFDRTHARQALQQCAQPLEQGRSYKVRLLLDQAGSFTVSAEPLTPETLPLRGILADARVSSADIFLLHKTTHRRLYAESYRAACAAGYDEVLFLNERGELTEGSFNNLFIEKDGELFTPPLACGLLAGIGRQSLLETHQKVHEKKLTPDDLFTADKIFVSNAVRGLRPMVLLTNPASGLPLPQQPEPVPSP